MAFEMKQSFQETFTAFNLALENLTTQSDLYIGLKELSLLNNIKHQLFQLPFLTSVFKEKHRSSRGLSTTNSRDFYQLLREEVMKKAVDAKANIENLSKLYNVVMNTLLNSGHISHIAKTLLKCVVGTEDVNCVIIKGREASNFKMGNLSSELPLIANIISQGSIVKKDNTMELLIKGASDVSYLFQISATNNRRLEAFVNRESWSSCERVLRPLGELISVSHSKLVDKEKLTSLLNQLYSAYLPNAFRLICRELALKLDPLISINVYHKGDKNYKEVASKSLQDPTSYIITPQTMYIPLLMRAGSPLLYAAVNKRSEIDLMFLQLEIDKLTQVLEEILSLLNLKLLAFEELKRFVAIEHGSHALAFDDKGQLTSFYTQQPMVLCDFCFVPSGANALEPISASTVFESRPDVARKVVELTEDKATEEYEILVNDKVKIELRHDVFNRRRGFDVVLTNVDVHSRWNGKSLQRGTSTLDDDQLLRGQTIRLMADLENGQEEEKEEVEALPNVIGKTKDDLSTSIVAEFMRPVVKMGAAGRHATMKDIFLKRKKEGPHASQAPQQREEVKLPHPELFRSSSLRVDKIESWEFSILETRDMTAKFQIVFALFHTFNYIDLFVIERPVFAEFIYEVQRLYNYRKNPFHNFDHGIQVAHTASLLVREPILHGLIDDLTGFSFILACLCHDIDHTGRTNAFEMASYSSLAIRYNDISILENHHASTTFKVLLEPKRNILKNVKENTLKVLRKSLVSNIMATDMRDHFELLTKYTTKREKYGDEFLEKIRANEDEKRNFIAFLTHSCDLTGGVKPFKTAREWSVRVSLEFSAQAKEEQELDLPVTPYMKDLDKPEVLAKQEIGFLNVISLPLWQLVNECLDRRLSHRLLCIENNIAEWKKEL